MRTHPGKRIRVSGEGEVPYLATYYRGSDAKGEPDGYTTLKDCRDLRSQGLGEFINRGRAFRRFDTSQPHDTKTYRASSRRGESLKITEPIMARYTEGERYAVAAVEGWR